MNKDEKNEKLAEIARRIEEHGFRANGNAIFNSIREAWNLGHKAGYNDGRADGFKEGLKDKIQYKQGQNDAWEIARRIVLGEEDGGLSYDELAEIFELSSYQRILLTFSAQECREKIDAFDSSNIKIGDFVNVTNRLWKALVVEKVSSNNVKVLFFNGEHGIVAARNCTKIGSVSDLEEEA